MNYGKQDPHSFCARGKKTLIAMSLVADTDVADGVDDSVVAVGVTYDESASKATRNYACYNYCPLRYHQRQVVELNCMMVLCLAINE